MWLLLVDSSVDWGLSYLQVWYYRVVRAAPDDTEFDPRTKKHPDTAAKFNDRREIFFCANCRQPRPGK
jgi:hypothetical protein